MKTENQTEICVLLEKPIWQMTGREFCALTQYANGASTLANETVPHRTANGVQALADALACSPSTIYTLMRTARDEDGSAENGGILRDAIVSRIGRRIVFNVELARSLANSCQKEKKEG